MTGFRGAQGKAASKPAEHFRTVLLQIVNFLFSLQKETAETYTHSKSPPSIH